METPVDLRVDLTSTADIKAQLPRIEEVVREKRQVAAQAQQEFETWDALLKRLRGLAGLVLYISEPTEPYFEPPSQAAQDAVVEIVDKEDRIIMPQGVAEALANQGHEVESPAAVFYVLSEAAEAGRIREVEPSVFAPNSIDPSIVTAWGAMNAVPEAHLGLDGPPPQSKAEGAVRVLGTNPFEPWTTQEVAAVMVGQGWMADSESDRASLSTTLSRLVSEKKIHRPKRGLYQLGPPSETSE